MASKSTSDEIKDWKDTQLWKILTKKSSPESESIRSALQNCMPEIQTVLNSASTSPANFTLHDADHSGRVAKGMVRLMPATTQDALSSYELALLLLSAYLHDIGMTPAQHRTESVYQFILTEDRTTLSDAEYSELRAWLDEQSEELEIPMSPGRPTSRILQEAALTVAHYCRFRHVAWATEWIRTNLSGIALGNYSHWVDDLALLCASHHFGYEKLKSDLLSPKMIAPQDIVHLRYLAVVLRVADILDFDPKRTPDILFQHRNITPSSVIYWHKDHCIAHEINADHIVVFAEPPDAHIHRAVENMIGDIEVELRIAHQLDTETHFDRAAFSRDPLPYRWEIKPYVHATIRPKHAAYEYINGGFRPDTQKLLQLVSGSGVYSDPMLAVREILQNAFDAVREEIAYERLEQPDPESAKVEEILGRLHHVKIFFSSDSDGNTLTCTDDGVGMTKDLIARHLLVSGTTQRRDLRRLERRCREKGFEVGRTGQFGIGVLSYFMLANRIDIHTRRSECPEDSDGSGWSFVTTGVGSFGELRKSAIAKHGTMVRLSLRNEVVDDPREWYGKLVAFIANTVARAPCEVSVHSTFSDQPGLNLQRGWTRLPETLGQTAMPQVFADQFDNVSDEEILPLAMKQSRVQRQRNREDLLSEINDCITWRTSGDFELAGIARGRVHVPIFNLPLGQSLAFLKVEAENGKMGLSPLNFQFSDKTVHATGPICDELLSWKGMHVKSLTMRNGSIFVVGPSLGGIAEIDFIDPTAGQLSLSREEIRLTDELQIHRFARHMIQEARCAIAEEISRSPFALLSAVMAGKGFPPPEGCFWLREEESRDGVVYLWEQIQFPTITGLLEPLRKDGSLENLTWNGMRVWCYGHMNWFSGQSGHGESWGGLTSAHRVVAMDTGNGGFACVPLWESRPNETRDKSMLGASCKFPPEWSFLCGTMGTGPVTWNDAHPLYNAVTQESRVWAVNLGNRPSSLVTCEDEIRLDRAKAATFMSIVASERAVNLWNGIVEQRKEFVHDILELVFGKHDAHRVVFSFLLQSGAKEGWKQEMFTFSADGCVKTTDGIHILQELPKPGAEWRILMNP
jgi:hypothetical protein